MHAAGFTHPGQVAPGMAVFCSERGMPGVVTATDGVHVEVMRPTGLVWRVRYWRLRPATSWERRQLIAIAALHRKSRRRIP
ncbi:hypothetical protein [Streptomyces sp. NPDC050560]|uniref:hypothetical protein n=1 Tax=Streptomyces sp. NPDC050560 TaxID=3365630 RepID=UPI0037A0816E